MGSYANSLLPQIRTILRGSDLSTVSAKAVRKQLVADGQDEAKVKENRKDIDAIIAEIFDELTGDADPGSPASQETPLSPRPSQAMPPSSLPEPLRTKVKSEHRVKDEKPSVASSSSAYANGSSRSGPSAAAETDEEMARRIQMEYDSLSRGRASRSAAQPARKKKAVKRKATDGSDGEKPKKRSGGGGGPFNKELILSDALANLLGEPQLSRPQTVKRIWEYVKSNGLQDQSDKRFINCDDKLRAVFHSDRVHMFTMNKLLVPHFADPTEITGKNEQKPAVPPPAPRAFSVDSDDDQDDDDDDRY